jgi:hypothetical protein
MIGSRNGEYLQTKEGRNAGSKVHDEVNNTPINRAKIPAIVVQNFTNPSPNGKDQSGGPIKPASASEHETLRSQARNANKVNTQQISREATYLTANAGRT